MDSGEKEIRKAFEDVTTNNVKACIAHSNETRRLTLELKEKIIKFDENLSFLDEKIVKINNLITKLQIKSYNGKTE